MMINASNIENYFKLPLLLIDKHIFSSVSAQKRNSYKVDKFRLYFLLHFNP